MKIDVERTHVIADKLMAFANAMRHGYIKHWKAHCMCIEIAELASYALVYMQGERLKNYVRNCLEMEGFRGSDCDTIADWLEANLLNKGVTA